MIEFNLSTISAIAAFVLVSVLANLLHRSGQPAESGRDIRFSRSPVSFT